MAHEFSAANAQVGRRSRPWRLRIESSAGGFLFRRECFFASGCLLKALVMDEPQIAGRRLAADCDPYLQRGDMDGMAAMLVERWSEQRIAELLASRDTEVLRTAVRALGAIGRMTACPLLAPVLRHHSAEIRAAAEDALWSVWFRAGGRTAQAVLHRIAQSIRDGDLHAVPLMLTELIRTYPAYAEAHHQRSQAYYLTSAYEQAVRDAARAVALNPWHFAARAVHAHGLAGLGRYHEALRSYQEVLRLHPFMNGIRESIQGVRRKLALAGV